MVLISIKSAIIELITKDYATSHCKDYFEVLYAIGMITTTVIISDIALP